MIAVDSSALIAILRREAEADAFIQVVARAGGCLISAVSYLETSMVLAGRTGSATTWSGLDTLIARAGMEVVPQDRQLATAARQAFLHYGKGRHPAALNLGDCATYALAKNQDLPLLFKGDDFTHTDLTPAL